MNYGIQCSQFEKIYNSSEIRNIYNKIDRIENESQNAYAHHNFDHVNNVMNITEQILKSLNVNNTLIEEAKIAAVLHDTGAVDGKQGHAYRSYEFAKKFFYDNKINLKNEQLVLDAIKNHSDGFDTDNIIQLALILADKLDIKYTRVAKQGYNIEGMRQMQYINDISLSIENDCLKIKFICDNKIDKNELEQYYFMKKVGSAISSFAKKFNLRKELYFNDRIWNEIFEL